MEINENPIYGTVALNKYHISRGDSYNYITAALMFLRYLSRFIYNGETLLSGGIISCVTQLSPICVREKKVNTNVCFSNVGRNSLAFLTDTSILSGCEQLLRSDVQRIEPACVPRAGRELGIGLYRLFR